MSLSKSNLKLITSLGQKKYRAKNDFFVAEGLKTVNELLESSFELYQLYCTEEFGCEVDPEYVNLITEAELKKISFLKSPNQVLAIFKIPKPKKRIDKGLVVALDGVNDPGNLGTIIRLCDWYGVEQLVCSKNTVDCYNPKVVQSTMGSLSRVAIAYVDLGEYLSKIDFPVFAAVMDGKSVYECSVPKDAVLIMGNEAKGISREIQDLISNKITIPRFGETQKAESLNVATATAILLNEFRRG